MNLDNYLSAIAYAFDVSKENLLIPNNQHKARTRAFNALCLMIRGRERLGFKPMGELLGLNMTTIERRCSKARAATAKCPDFARRMAEAHTYLAQIEQRGAVAAKCTTSTRVFQNSRKSRQRPNLRLPAVSRIWRPSRTCGRAFWWGLRKCGRSWQGVHDEFRQRA